MKNEIKSTVHNHVNKIYHKNVATLHKDMEGYIKIKGDHLIRMLDEAFKKGQDNTEARR